MPSAFNRIISGMLVPMLDLLTPSLDNSCRLVAVSSVALGPASVNCGLLGVFVVAQGICTGWAVGLGVVGFGISGCVTFGVEDVCL